jgi:hypothetical protein
LEIFGYLGETSRAPNHANAQILEIEPSLCALRLTCRAMRDKAHKAFLVSYFRRIEVDFLHSRFQQLMDIQEGDFADTVEELCFRIENPEIAFDSDGVHMETGFGAVMLAQAIKRLSNLKTITVHAVGVQDHPSGSVRKVYA